MNDRKPPVPMNVSRRANVGASPERAEGFDVLGRAQRGDLFPDKGGLSFMHESIPPYGT